MASDNGYLLRMFEPYEINTDRIIHHQYCYLLGNFCLLLFNPYPADTESYYTLPPV